MDGYDRWRSDPLLDHGWECLQVKLVKLMEGEICEWG